jgi:YHS domain-containing protein
MKKLLVICIVFMLFTVTGCGNKPQDDSSKTATETGVANRVSLTDPVDGSKIENFEEAKYSYVYNGMEYRFNSKDNYEAFKKDPSKYVTE